MSKYDVKTQGKGMMSKKYDVKNYHIKYDIKNIT